MRIIIEIIVFLLAISIGAVLLPAIIGVIVGIELIKAGSIIKGLISIAIGLIIEAAIFFGNFGTSGGDSMTDSDCPYCGSSDNDGAHCYDCDGDF